jgi:hypothetical protein
LDPTLREKIIELLKMWAQRLLKEFPEDRGNLHRLAEAVATFPSADLLSTLSELVAKDSEQWRKEKEEFKREHRAGKVPRDSGARTNYAFRYGQNMIALATGTDADIAPSESDKTEPSEEMTAAVIGTLKNFLLDREFGEDSARAIGTLKSSPYWRVGGRENFGARFDFVRIEERRALRAAQGIGLTDPAAALVLDAMVVANSEGTDEARSHAAKLAKAPARMECGPRQTEVAEAIHRIQSVEASSEYLMVLLQLGHSVDGAIAEACLDQLDARREQRTWEYSDNWFKWEQLLVLMICSGKVEEAIARLLKYDRHAKNYDLRNILQAQAKCGHAAAFQSLLSLKDLCAETYAVDDWLRAIAACGTPESGDALLTLLLADVGKNSYHNERDFAGAIGRLADIHEPLADRILHLASADGVIHPIVHSIISRNGSEEFLLRLLNLPNIAAIGGAIADALHNICVEDQPVEGQTGMFERVPRPIPKVRAKLFAKANAGGADADDCIRLLQTIDDWRDGFGDPWDEERHPDLSVDRAWPPVAQSAWNAALGLRKNAE